MLDTAAWRQLARYDRRVGLRTWRRKSREESEGIVLWHWGGWRLPFDRELEGDGYATERETNSAPAS